MIPFKSIRMQTKTQAFGEASFYKERNINIRLKAGI
jgi:hypothetical protein